MPPGPAADAVMDADPRRRSPGVARHDRRGASARGAYRCEYRVRRRDGPFRWVEANGRVDLGRRRRADAFSRGADRHRPSAADRSRLARAQRGARDARRQRRRRAGAGRGGACAKRRRWRRSASSPAASRTTSTTFSLSSSATSTRRGARCSPASRQRATAIDGQARRKGAERAAALTQRLLAFSRRQPLAPKPVNLNRLVAGMADLLHRALGETVRARDRLDRRALWRSRPTRTSWRTRSSIWR